MTKIKIRRKYGFPNRIFFADQALVKQTDDIASHPYLFHHLAVMPDCHPGYGLMIGGVAAFKDAICPYGVGVDCGCGMLAIQTNIDADILRDRDGREEIKEAVKKVIPMGFSHHQDLGHLSRIKNQLLTVDATVPASIMALGTVGKDDILRQLGTLGGGNHFVEFQQDRSGHVWLMIHSGSRNLGNRMCKMYEKIAEEYCILHGIEIPSKELAILPVSSDEGKAYIEAMSYCLQFAHDNRMTMMSHLMGVFGQFVPDLKMESSVHVHHNYAALEEHFGEVVWVHRKGATYAGLGSFGAIPGSMGTHSYIVTGKGSFDSFKSCSHGSGRQMSRGQAKRNISMDEFKTAMGDVVFDFDKSLLDESPGAYKPIETVMDNQADLVNIQYTLEPLISIKAVGCKDD